MSPLGDWRKPRPYFHILFSCFALIWCEWRFQNSKLIIRKRSACVCVVQVYGAVLEVGCILRVKQLQIIRLEASTTPVPRKCNVIVSQCWTDPTPPHLHYGRKSESLSGCVVSHFCVIYVLQCDWVSTWIMACEKPIVCPVRRSMPLVIT
jgi:hypothetical protein